jgi:integrase
MSSKRLSLTEKIIAQLPAADAGQYVVRDLELKGFYLLVGKRRRTYMVQGDLRRNGRRVATLKVSVGEAAETTLREARSLAKSYLVEIRRGKHPKTKDDPRVAEGGSITLAQAWHRYREGHMRRKGRSERTIDSYRDHVERLMKDWLDTPITDLAEHPVDVSDLHDKISKQNGPVLANLCMRTLRAIYNHARKRHRELPAYNPTDAVDWNPEHRRNTAMGLLDLPAWFAQLEELNNPVRREFHLFTLLSGSRPAALRNAKLQQLDLRRRVLHLPNPKGGAKRAFDIPLSRQMILCLVRAIRAGRIMYPVQSLQWLFPSDSETGNMREQKEPRSRLSKWGNDLRQSYRTIAAAAGVSEVDCRLLMNHAIQGVNAGYITRHKLLEDHLRHQQQMVSDTILRSAMPASDE